MVEILEVGRIAARYGALNGAHVCAVGYTIVDQIGPLIQVENRSVCSPWIQILGMCLGKSHWKSLALCSVYSYLHS